MCGLVTVAECSLELLYMYLLPTQICLYFIWESVTVSRHLQWEAGFSDVQSVAKALTGYNVWIGRELKIMMMNLISNGMVFIPSFMAGGIYLTDDHNWITGP